MTFKIIFVLILVLTLTVAEIHRARPGNNFRRNKYRPIQPQPHIPSNTSFSRWLNGEFLGHKNAIWLYSSISAGLVGLSGLFPLLVIPISAADILINGGSTKSLRLLLSFAVGCLLGDVFLHLLPEAWSHIHNFESPRIGLRSIGLWILAGMLSFLFIEKMFPDDAEDDEDEDDVENIRSDFKSTKMLLSKDSENLLQDGLTKLKNVFSGNCLTPNGYPQSKSNGSLVSKPLSYGLTSNQNSALKSAANGHISGSLNLKEVHKGAGLSGFLADDGGIISNNKNLLAGKLDKPAKKPKIKVSGWLNLIANVVDNFTHGLAVAGSYCISTKMGILTTFAILLHEIPHEIGDFAILLRSGFDRWSAARAQFVTAFGGIVGALLALSAESTKIAGDSTAWILPFTAGGFINIALVTVIPDILKEDKPWESLKQMFVICLGIVTMASITIIFD